MAGQVPVYEFNVSVENEKSSPTYVIIYTLNEDSAHLQFVGPDISGDVGNNISFSIANNGSSLILVDSDATIGNICIKLVTAPRGMVYTSADPEVFRPSISISVRA